MDPEPLELPAGGLDDGVVAIRPYRLEDAELLAEGAKDPDVIRYAFVHWGDTEQIAERIETTWPESARAGRFANFSIRDSSSDELLGHLVIFGVNRDAQRCELGYWLRREARGRRAAGRAVELACAWAFGELGMQRVQAAAAVDNVASLKTLERAGFTREGVMRSFIPTPDGGRDDYVLYARLAEG
ncbi:MAG: GNAT family N-acetyltransferase [Gaiellaceae bacterium]